MTVAQWLKQAIAALEQSGCPDPAIDARWMLEDFLGASPAGLRAQGERELAQCERDDLAQMLRRRCAGEPVQYITGRADFMGLRFFVDSRVLIPRADTENLVELALGMLRGRSAADVLDLCAGSGAIGLAIGKLCPGAKIALADINRDALAVARQNADALGIDARLLQGDLFAPVQGRAFDLIACNPPYIPAGDLPFLQAEVRREPMLALNGGADGLDFYRRIARHAPAHLKPGGHLLLEVGAGQWADVLYLVKEHIDCADAGVARDLSGIERVIWARSV